MRKIVLVFTLCFISLGYTALAQTQTKSHPIDQWLEKYLADDKNVSTVAIIDGYVEAEKKWDKELNNAYNALMKKLNKQSQTALKTSQKTWLKFRDEESKTISGLYSDSDGTMAGINIEAEIMTIIRNRALQLKEYLESISITY